MICILPWMGVRVSVARVLFGDCFTYFNRVRSYWFSASTLLHEMGYQSEMIEKQLAPIDKNQVQASYKYAEYLPEWRAMIQAWSDHIDSVVV